VLYHVIHHIVGLVALKINKTFDQNLENGHHLSYPVPHNDVSATYKISDAQKVKYSIPPFIRPIIPKASHLIRPDF
jgi:hypothetical protein